MPLEQLIQVSDNGQNSERNGPVVSGDALEKEGFVESMSGLMTPEIEDGIQDFEDPAGLSFSGKLPSEIGLADPEAEAEAAK